MYITMSRHRRVCLLIALALAAAPSSAADEIRRSEKRVRIDSVARETLHRLFSNKPKAQRLYDKAVAYAVFSNIKISLVITGGGGTGVAVDKAGGRTYMKMATAGLNLGLGGQKYQVVFLFQDRPTFERFVEQGWEAEGSANAVAGNLGTNVEASFRNGMAVFQLTQAGLMLQADISGTKYWKSKKLNR